jgi:hypothetical protein
MNAQARALPPIATALLPPSGQPSTHPTRRHLVGDHRVDQAALDHFNRLLEKLHHVPLACDQLATAARELIDQPLAASRYPGPIAQRLEIAGRIDRMMTDRHWVPDRQATEAARLVVDYLHDDATLIPSAIPTVGHLDDAILIDAAWPQLAGEVDSYQDFCRLRAIEAELRGCDVASMPFSRDDWQRARVLEAELIAHCRRSGCGSYLPAPGAALFRVS